MRGVLPRESPVLIVLWLRGSAGGSEGEAPRSPAGMKACFFLSFVGLFQLIIEYLCCAQRSSQLRAGGDAQRLTLSVPPGRKSPQDPPCTLLINPECPVRALHLLLL